MVFLGGGLGSLLRYGISVYWPTSNVATFPWATFWANVGASILLGLFVGMSLKFSMDKNSQLFLIVGLCGGFSTFSTFSKEVFVMIEAGHFSLSLIYVLASVLVCVGAIFVGVVFSKI
ncbi:UNVERIFIED_CONTAM: hypothetical protein GTU68_047683 [Idotea baltica]|nr:hypothetical protein [Idotea baltica]